MAFLLAIQLCKMKLFNLYWRLVRWIVSSVRYMKIIIFCSYLKLILKTNSRGLKIICRIFTKFSKYFNFVYEIRLTKYFKKMSTYFKDTMTKFTCQFHLSTCNFMLTSHLYLFNKILEIWKTNSCLYPFISYYVVKLSCLEFQ